jgi:parvulin-like peptidyl-prolyl isomerase
MGLFQAFGVIVLAFSMIGALGRAGAAEGEGATTRTQPAAAAVSADAKATTGAKAVGLPSVEVTATTDTSAVRQFQAEVSDAIRLRVAADAQRMLGASKEANELWPAREGKALAYLHAINLAARLARAEGMASSAPVLSSIENQLAGEYQNRVYNQMRGEPTVDPAQVEKIYRENLSKFSKPGQFWMRHIFLNTVDHPDQDEKKQADAKKALEELKEGKPFEEVAKKYSDVEQNKDETVGPLKYGEINPELEKAVLALKPGAHTEVVKSKWGYNILQLVKSEPPSTSTLEEVRPRIEDGLRKEAMNQARKRVTEQLEAKYPATKKYDELDDPNASSKTLVIDSGFLKVTVEDYRNRIREFTSETLAQLKNPGARESFLDNWMETERIKAAARDLGVTRSPDIAPLTEYFTSRTLADSYLNTVLQRMPPPGEDEVRKFYDENGQYFTTPAEVRLREIVISYRQPQGATPRDYFVARKSAQAKIQEVVEKLKGGAKFTDLVKQYSTAASAKNDGDTSFTYPQSRSQKIAEAVQKLKEGESTEPIEEEDAFGVYRLEARRGGEKAPLDEPRKAAIRRFLLQNQQRERYLQILVSLARAYGKAASPDEIRKVIEGK